MAPTATTSTPVHTQVTGTHGVHPRPTVHGLVQTGPQRWPWHQDEDERADHRRR